MKKIAFFLLFAAFYACLALGQNQLSKTQLLRFSTAEKVTFAAFRRGDAAERFALPAGDSLALQSVQAGSAGRRSYRLQQMRRGIPVFGAGAIVVEENGALTWAKGRFRQSADAGAVPALTENTALDRVLTALPAEKYAWQHPAYERELQTASADASASFYPKGKLVYLPDNVNDPASGGIRLAWQFDLFALAPEVARNLVFVDARTGDILRSIPLMHSGDVPAKGFARYVADTVDFNTESLPGDTLYRLRDLLRNIHVRDALNLQSNPNADFVHHSSFWGKPEHRTPVAAHWGMKQWYDYMLQTHGWQGFANDSNPMLAWVHFDHNFNNAFWNGNWVNFGDGDGVRFGPLVQLDIVAHECAHALVQNTCGLIYQGEPGALNEGLCDIFATLVERYAFPDAWNWKLGEAAYFDHANGLRRLDYPNAAGHPDTYGGQFWVNTEGCAPGLTNDQCGIHSNCGVLGKFFYILAQGETGVSESGMPYNVTGIGMNNAAGIIFRSLEYLLPADGFADMRAATLQAAVELYPGAEVEVAKAWCAVGVGECTVAVSDSIVLLAPATVDTFQHGQPIEVLWTATAGVKTVNLYLSLNDGASWQLVQAGLDAASGSFEMIAPPVFSPVCRLRLADAADPFVSARTDTTFVITGCGLKAHFLPSVTKVCFGQPFYAVNDSPDKTVDFKWRWNGADFPSPDSLLEIPAMNVPGAQQIELIADDGAGCRDTFSLDIEVLPQVTAAFTAETHGNTMVANAHYQEADNYLWYYGGQQVGANSPALTLTGLAPGMDSLRLIVAENGCPDGVAEVVEGVTVASTLPCTGDKLEIKSATYTSDIIGIAEYKGKLYLAMPGAAAELDKNTHAFKIFKPENTNGLLSLPITSVTVRQDGKVLFGTGYGGVVSYNPKDMSWEKISIALPSNTIKKMETGDDGTTWILAETISPNFPWSPSYHLLRWNADGSLFQFPPLGYVYDMHPVDGELWLIDDSNVDVKLKKTSQQSITPVLNPLFTTKSGFRGIASNAEKIWISVSSSGNKGIMEIDKATGVDTFFHAGNSNLPVNYSLGLIEADKNGGLWMMNYIPVYYDGDGSFTSIPALTPGDETVFFVDSANTLWIGNTLGLRAYSNNAISVIDLSTSDLKKPSWENYIGGFRDLNAIPGGNKIAVFQEGAKLLDVSDLMPKKIAPGCPAPGSKFAVDSSGWIWMVSGNKQIWRLAFSGGICQEYDIPGITSVSDVKAWGKYIVFKGEGKLFIHDPKAGTTLSKTISQGSLYFGNGRSPSFWAILNSDSLLELRPDFSIVYHQTSTLQSSYNQALAINTKGDIWIKRRNGQATFTDHLLHYDPVTGKETLLTSLNLAFGSEGINTIHSDEKGNLWVGYYNSGVVKLDPAQADKYEQFTSLNGLPSNHVNLIDFTADGRIWVATNNGIGVINPTSDTLTARFDFSNICQSRPTTILNTTLGATSFEWRLDGQPIATAKNLTHTFDKPGKYILTLVARNAQGCETATSRVIEVYPSADLSPIPATWANCDNSTQLEAPAGMAAYEWREASGILVDTAQKLPVTQSGLYTLKVTDHCGNTATKQITVLLADCVWPGDVNTDGIVDYRDWVAMTLVFGYTGPARDDQGISFQGYPALPWNGQLPNGANIKHADADGNGIIDLLDFEAIEVNYGKTHGAYPGLDGPKPSPMQFVPVILEAPSDSNGHKMTVGILAIDSSGLLNSFSGAGLVFGWNKPAPIEFDAPPQADFSVAGAFGKEGVAVRSIARLVPNRNEMHLARAVTDHRNRTNVSLLAQVDFIVIEDNIGVGDTLDIVFSVSGAQALTGDGMFLPIGTGQGKFTLVGDTLIVSGDHFLPALPDLLVFPNPSEGLFTAILPAAASAPTTLTVHDVQGRPVWRQEKSGAGAVIIDLTALPAGSYYLRAVNRKGQAVRQLMKL